MLLSRIDQTGLTTHTLDLTRGLIMGGHEVFVIVGVGGSVENNKGLIELRKRFLQSGAKIIDFKIPKGNVLTKGIKSVLGVVFIQCQLLKINPDIIHVQAPYMSFIPWLLGKKFISTLHVNALVRAFKYKNATHLIAISEETKKYAIDLFGYDESNITKVVHGISKEFSETMSLKDKIKFKESNNIPIDKVVIGMVASIEKRKGHDILLNVIKMLDPDIKKSIHIVLVGSSKYNNTNQWLEDIIDTTETKNLVSRFEYQNPKSFYDIMDIFVFPSSLEGLGLVNLEAMMSKCCLVRSNCEGAYDTTKHGEDGFIFDVNRKSELLEIVEKLIKNPELRNRIATNGQKQALKNFSIESMTKNTIEVYKKIL